MRRIDLDERAPQRIDLIDGVRRYSHSIVAGGLLEMS